MKTKLVLTTLLGLAILAVPAAVPASQPADVRLVQLTPAVTVAAPATTHFAELLVDPRTNGEMSVELVAGYTTLEWIDQDPFAL
jgi:TRAP-type C4-dicarboxylate transport system substrate-binding protein